MSAFKGIPIVPTSQSAPRSGDKYRTAQGFTAIKDGIKASAHADAITIGRKPQWLRAPMPAGKAFDAVRETVKELGSRQSAKKRSARISANAGMRVQRL